ncbi:MAG: helix-turn-helix domain-containing protein [Phycisphaerae bacterium]
MKPKGNQDKLSAPALARGIAVLRYLESEPEASLETITRYLNLPKASLLRILATLCELGLVFRDSVNRRYRLKARLVAQDADDREFVQSVQQSLDRLSGQTGQTVEWYQTTEQGLLLVQRCEPPDKEVVIRAGIGFVRQWKGELNAVCLAGYAGRAQMPESLAGFCAYVRHGVQRELSAAEVKKKIFTAQDRGFAVDSAFNDNGVRRIASWVGQKEKFKGVLALAERFMLNNRVHEKHLAILNQEISMLKQNYC